MLLTIACRRWLTRLLLYAAMLALLWVVWHRVQPPWWDTAADIQEMHDFIEDGDGYEGVDEYVPAHVDPYELNKDAPKVVARSGDSVLVHIDEWKAETKAFSAQVSRPEQLRLRLFNYPAWRVEVNGRAVAATAQPVTGEIVFSVNPGTNRVRVAFTRTRDRLVGGIISVAALVLLIMLTIFCMKGQRLSARQKFRTQLRPTTSC
jgi:hypothetical protein